MKKAAILLLIVAACVLAAPYLFRSEQHQSYQGWIEANLRFIGAETSARLTDLKVAEGEIVQKGQMLFRFEDDIARAKVDAAEASLAAARAKLEQANAAQKRPQEIDILKASRRQAEANLDLASQELERVRTLAKSGTTTKANLDSAVATQAANQAALDNINGQIELAAMPARQEAIRQAQADMDAALAELEAANSSLERLTIEAPVNGRVQQLYYNKGEIVPAGRPVVSILPPADVRIRFYVPEGDVAGLHIGQKLTVTCDACGPIAARISFISQTTEYTPPEIYSREERAKLVYRVDAIPEQPETLNPGLPVDVMLSTDQTEK
ncbi:HlyD family secretion protein [Agrobacterium sp. ES01]|uniref:HlyD family secretion protein n=1 Tax=Agrobacterium sp. ES01 TaxID=3420714 RepID=UPI003D0E7784